MSKLYHEWKERWKYLSPEEMLSPDGLNWLNRGIMVMNVEFMDKYYGFREYLSKPFTVNTGNHRLRGYRSPKESVPLGGNPFHPMGLAADTTVQGMEEEEVIVAAEDFGFRGLGLYDTFVHIDYRPILKSSQKVFKWDNRF